MSTHTHTPTQWRCSIPAQTMVFAFKINELITATSCLLMIMVIFTARCSNTDSMWYRPPPQRMCAGHGPAALDRCRVKMGIQLSLSLIKWIMLGPCSTLYYQISGSCGFGLWFRSQNGTQSWFYVIKWDKYVQIQDIQKKTFSHTSFCLLSLLCT